MSNQEKLTMHTPNLAEKNYEVLSKMFPNAVTETTTGYDEDGEPIVERAIDAEVLAQEINTHVVSGKEERYQFTWPDKKKSVLLANAPIAATLRPCREESVDFDHTENLYIEGDNLDVLKLLRETYLNRVKMIYIDPPYNTGKDFIYEDNFAEETSEFLQRDSQYDEQGNRLTSNFDSNGRFHTDWLNMMYPRLRVTRDLLTDDGVIFISIDDNEVMNLRKICDEVFGVKNFLGSIVWKKKTNGNNVGSIPPVHDYIIAYSKNWTKVCEIGFEITAADMEANYSNSDNDPRGPWKTMDLSANHKGPYFTIENPETGDSFLPPKGRYWVFNEKEVLRRIEDGRIIFGKSGTARPVQKVFLSDKKIAKRKAESWWDSHGMNEDATSELSQLFGIPKLFNHPKPTKLLKNLCSIVLTEGDIAMDFFSGSGTMADAIMQLSREKNMSLNFIMVQVPEDLQKSLSRADSNAKASIDLSIEFLKKLGKPLYLTELGKERIRRAGEKIKEEAGLTAQNLDTGFRVLKLDSSNMKKVYYTPEEYAQMSFDFQGFMDNIKPDRSEEDLLFQVMLDLGIPLSAKIEKIGKVFKIDGNYLIACFDKVDSTTITEIAQEKPYYAVFRDSSFTSDSSLVNVEQIFNTYSPNTIRRVL